MSAAVLGFKIDSRDAPAAAVDLDKLMASAVKVEAAVDKLEATAAGLGSALSRTAQGVRQAQTPVESLGRSFQQQDGHVRAFRAEIERLTAKYQPMAQATKAYEATVSEINRAHQLGVISAGQMQKALDAERMAFERLRNSANAASQAMQAANQNVAARGAGGAGNQGFNAANAGYQFQDVAVTAAMGMNPLMIGLQQGTQLASVISMMERPVAGLATAFASLISPVSLVTIGLVAGSAALIQYGSAWFSGGGDDIEGDLEAQAELIARVTERWGEATPALKAYADEMARAKEIEELQQAITIRTGEEYGKIADSLATFADRYGDFVSVLTAASNATGSQRTEISELGTAYFTLQERIATNKAAIEDFDRVRQAATRAAAMEGAEELGVFRSGMDELTNSTERARDELRKLQLDAATALTSAYPSRGGYGGVIRSPDGTIQNDPFSLPFDGPVPGRRPLIELAGDGSTPGAPMILNSDGRLVAVPTPGQRPNHFEREADLPQFSSFRANRNTYWSRDVLQEEIRRRETGEVFKGFFTDFGQALRNNSGDLGDALMEGLSNAVANAASAAWDKVGNMAANFLVNSLLGQPSTGLMNKAIGFTGANTTLGELLGAGAGVAANQNVAGGFSGLASVPTTDVASYIASAASKRGIDPKIALRVAKSEGGLNSWNLRAGYVKNGFQEPSYGPFQLLNGGPGTGFPKGLGNDFISRTGLNPALASNGPAGVDFALDHAAKNGWGAWYGAAKVGVGKWDGIGAGSGMGSASEAVAKLADSAGAATKGLDTLGGGLGQVGQALSTSFFPAAPSAPGGGGGGVLFGWLGGLFGGGGGNPSLAKYLPLTGLFADGTNYAAGGMAIVGERGPELVNLPAGSQVFDTNRSGRMMGGNDNGGGNQRPVQNFYLDGARGDDHIRELARQGAQEGIHQYNQSQQRGGFGNNQKTFNARKG